MLALKLKEIREKYQTAHYDAKNLTHWVGRNIYSRIATLIIKLLLPTPITANQVTAGWMILGLFSCYLFTFGKYWISILAALLIQLHIVLDYVDGPIARIKNSSETASKKGIYIERIGHDLIYTLFFYCIAIGSIKKIDNFIAMFIFGFSASIGYFFYKYTRRAKIYCTLAFDFNKNRNINFAQNKSEPVKKTVSKDNLLKMVYKKTQPIWDPASFTILTLFFTLFDITYVLPIFYGLTYPIQFVISYVYQAKIDDRWVYDWVKNFG